MGESRALSFHTFQDTLMVPQNWKIMLDFLTDTSGFHFSEALFSNCTNVSRAQLAHLNSCCQLLVYHSISLTNQFMIMLVINSLIDRITSFKLVCTIFQATVDTLDGKQQLSSIGRGSLMLSLSTSMSVVTSPADKSFNDSRIHFYAEALIFPKRLGDQQCSSQ